MGARLVVPTGIEPVSTASEAIVISIGPRDRLRAADGSDTRKPGPWQAASQEIDRKCEIAEPNGGYPCVIALAKQRTLPPTRSNLPIAASVGLTRQCVRYANTRAMRLRQYFPRQIIGKEAVAWVSMSEANEKPWRRCSRHACPIISQTNYRSPGTSAQNHHEDRDRTGIGRRSGIAV